jgi:hypothetical protein
VPAAEGRLLLGIARTGDAFCPHTSQTIRCRSKSMPRTCQSSAFSAKVSLLSKRLKARLMSGGPLSAGILKPRSSFHALFPLVCPVWSPGARHSEHLYPGADSSRVVAWRPVWRLN